MSLWTDLGAESGSVPLLLRARRRLSPDSVYLRWRDSSWTFDEVLAQAERFAGFLRSVGIAESDLRCGSYLPNCPQALWTWFGTLLAGNVYVPFNRAQRGELFADQLDRAGISVLVTDAAGVEDLPPLESLSLRYLLVVDGDSGEAGSLQICPYEVVETIDPWAGALLNPLSPGSIMFSSGSTGRSKAVVLPHNQAFRGAVHIASAMGLRSDDVWHEWLPHYHMMGALYALLAPLAAGATVDLRPRFSRSRFWREVREARATVIAGMANLIRAVAEPSVENLACAESVRLALIAGTDPEMKRTFADRFSLRVVDFYGMTEAEPVTVPSQMSKPDWSHGRADSDFDVAIIDDDGEFVPAGVVGEIVCRPRRSGVLFHEYEQDPRSTVTAWRDLWFHTGDRGFLDRAGHLNFLERSAMSLRHLGENVSAFELESIVSKGPGVATALALGIPVGEGEDDVKVVVIPEPGADINPADLHAWCRQKMAGFMVPRYIEVREALATFGIGKVDRAVLLDTEPPVWDAKRELTTAKQP